MLAHKPIARRESGGSATPGGRWSGSPRPGPGGPSVGLWPSAHRRLATLLLACALLATLGHYVVVRHGPVLDFPPSAEQAGSEDGAGLAHAQPWWSGTGASLAEFEQDVALASRLRDLRLEQALLFRKRKMLLGTAASGFGFSLLGLAMNVTPRESNPESDAQQPASPSSLPPPAPFLFAAVHSEFASGAQRRAARAAWVDEANALPGVAARFVVGAASAAERAALEAEARANGDLEIGWDAGRLSDEALRELLLQSTPPNASTNNVSARALPVFDPERTLRTLRLAQSVHPARFVLHARDWSWVDAPGLVSELWSSCSRAGCVGTRLYWGRDVQRGELSACRLLGPAGETHVNASSEVPGSPVLQRLLAQGTLRDGGVPEAYVAQTSLEEAVPHMAESGFVLSEDLVRLLGDLAREEGSGGEDGAALRRELARRERAGMVPGDAEVPYGPSSERSTPFKIALNPGRAGLLQLLPAEDLALGLWLLPSDLDRVDSPRVVCAVQANWESDAPLGASDSGEGSAAATAAPPPGLLPSPPQITLDMCQTQPLVLYPLSSPAQMQDVAGAEAACKEEERLKAMLRRLSAPARPADPLRPGREGAARLAQAEDGARMSLKGGDIGVRLAGQQPWTPDASAVLLVRPRRRERVRYMEGEEAGATGTEAVPLSQLPDSHPQSPTPDAPLSEAGTLSAASRLGEGRRLQEPGGDSPRSWTALIKTTAPHLPRAEVREPFLEWELGVLSWEEADESWTWRALPEAPWDAQGRSRASWVGGSRRLIALSGVDCLGEEGRRGRDRGLSATLFPFPAPLPCTVLFDAHKDAVVSRFAERLAAFSEDGLLAAAERDRPGIFFQRIGDVRAWNVPLERGAVRERTRLLEWAPAADAGLFLGLGSGRRPRDGKGGAGDKPRRLYLAPTAHGGRAAMLEFAGGVAGASFASDREFYVCSPDGRFEHWTFDIQRPLRRGGASGSDEGGRGSGRQAPATWVVRALARTPLKAPAQLLAAGHRVRHCQFVPGARPQLALLSAPDGSSRGRLDVWDLPTGAVQRLGPPVELGVATEAETRADDGQETKPWADSSAPLASFPLPFPLPREAVAWVRSSLPGTPFASFVSLSGELSLVHPAFGLQAGLQNITSPRAAPQPAPLLSDLLPFANPSSPPRVKAFAGPVLVDVAASPLLQGERVARLLEQQPQARAHLWAASPQGARLLQSQASGAFEAAGRAIRHRSYAAFGPGVTEREGGEADSEAADSEASPSSVPFVWPLSLASPASASPPRPADLALWLWRLADRQQGAISLRLALASPEETHEALARLLRRGALGLLQRTEVVWPAGSASVRRRRFWDAALAELNGDPEARRT